MSEPKKEPKKETKEEPKKETKEQPKEQTKEETKEEPKEEPKEETKEESELTTANNPKSTEDAPEDPSIAKMQKLQKLGDDPPKLPGMDILTAEPKATIAATKMLDILLTSLSDPKLAQNIIDNITKSVELSLENKLNKIEYLKNDTKHLKDKKDNTTIINSIHNETLKQTPIQVAVKGGNKPFFTEEECSFF